MTRKQIGAVLGVVVLAVAAPLLTLALLHGRGGETHAAPSACTAPDNGSGTVELPPNCDYIAPDEPMKIIDGLPPGTTIELDPTFDTFNCAGARTFCSIGLPGGTCEGAGGDLGGTASCADATLGLQVTGTGSLAGFNRSLSVEVESEFHWASRNPGDPVQTFNADLYHLYGEVFGDPDFCTFRITAGTANAMASPGETTLSEQLAGDFAVDSFFDISYEIEFEGCPASQLDGYMGTTPGTVTIQLDASEWSELLYPSGHPMAGQSIDLAFAIRGEESDTDGDGLLDATDNCPATSNAGQEDYDGDGIPGTAPGATGRFGGDACDPEDDNDSKGLGPPPGFFSDSKELFIGTDPMDECADTAAADDEWGPLYGQPVSPWPPDFNDTGFTDIGDLVALANHWVFIGNPYSQRHDLNANTVCDIGDLVALATYWPGSGRDTCTVG